RTRLDGQLLEVRAVLVALRQPEPLLVGEGAVVGDRLVVHVRAVLVVGADRVRVPELVVDVLALDAALAEVDQRAVARHMLQPLRVHLGDAGGGLRGRARRRLGGRALVGRLRRRRGRCGRGGGGGRGRGRRGRRRLGRARRGGAAGRGGATDAPLQAASVAAPAASAIVFRNSRRFGVRKAMVPGPPLLCAGIIPEAG